jgi:hypothetical protein
MNQLVDMIGALEIGGVCIAGDQALERMGSPISMGPLDTAFKCWPVPTSKAGGCRIDDGALEVAGGVFGAGPSMEGPCVPPRLSVNFCPYIDDGSLEVTGAQFAAGPTSMNSGCSNTVFTCPRID